jgi:actin related protein 2/3 complex subunit 1A/1B
VTNKIVSCSHDRNAFVWTFETESGVWKPALVILRIDRAALDVKWSFDGLRFAVASGAKCVPVCTYEHSHDWWICKMIKKKFKSTVLCCAFHPSNGQLLATGCADFKCRIVSTFATDVDGSNVNAGPFAQTTGPLEFGEVYAELSSLGWIHAVAWAPSGNTLAYAGHDSSVFVATLGVAAEPPVQVVRLHGLPICSLLFLSDKALLCAGHDFNPLVIARSNEWKVHGFIDGSKDDKATAEAAEGAAGGSSVSKARELFKSKTRTGQEIKTESDALKTKHERAITGLSNATPRAGNVQLVSTSSLDGRLITWNLSALDISLATLGI